MAHPPSPNRPGVAASAAPLHEHEAAYAALLEAVRARFAHVAAKGEGRWFTTDATGLYELYLEGLSGERQTHACAACRRFIETYGALAAIREDGGLTPAFWEEARCPPFYQPAMRAMAEAVGRAGVTGPFLTLATIWGKPLTGAWPHFAVSPDAPARGLGRLLTPHQTMAAKREDFRTVSTALEAFSPTLLHEALRVLKTDSVHMSERFVGPVQWLLDLHEKRRRTRGTARDNVLWRAVASAPEGYCHPRASVIGSLLEDIASGAAFPDIRVRFNAKVAPLAYQRPQAPPAAGNIAMAEKIVEQLGIGPSLERRFARLEELETLWRPAAPAPAGKSMGGVFRHLLPKARPAEGLALPPVTMTWIKFAATVLPGATRMELDVPATGAFIAFTTAVHPAAPPILKWDREGRRNPVAWYVYPNGSPASQWGLAAGWRTVTAISALPTIWGDQPMPFLGEGVMLVLEGAADQGISGNALFPSFLRDDLHGIRATIEAYAGKATLHGREMASACGYDIRKSSGTINQDVRVMSGGQWTRYIIDRWD